MNVKRFLKNNLTNFLNFFYPAWKCSSYRSKNRAEARFHPCEIRFFAITSGWRCRARCNNCRRCLPAFPGRTDWGFPPPVRECFPICPAHKRAAGHGSVLPCGSDRRGARPVRRTDPIFRVPFFGASGDNGIDMTQVMLVTEKTARS